MAILKKRPVLKTADDFINATPEITLVKEDIAESNNTVEETSQQDNTDDIKQSNNVNITIKKQDTSLSDKAKEILNIDQNGEEDLKRVTTYIVDSLNKKVKILSALSGKKEYQLWNEALLDLLEKYKKTGL